MRFERVRVTGLLAAVTIGLILAIPRPALAEDETLACNPDGQLIAYGEVRVGCTIEVVAEPIPNFPALGTLGFLSTFTSGGGLICTDLKTVDTGPPTPGATLEMARRSLGVSR
jgi:hypothetical protein